MNLLNSTRIFIILITSVLSVNAQEQEDRSDGPNKDKILEFYETQRYAEAAKYLEGFYPAEVNDAKVLAQLGYVNMMAGKLSQAENSYLKLYAQQPKSLPTLFNLATIQLKRGNDEKAKAYYTEIVAIDSTNFNAYKQLAGLTKEGLVLEKLNYLKKANALNPIDADVVFDLCGIYFKMNFHDRANAVLIPALQADTANMQLLKMKMPISMASKKYQEAIQTGQKLLSFGDSSSFVMNNLAKSYFLQIDYKNALQYFLKVKDKAADNETLLYNIALCYRGLKDYKSASTYLNQVITAAISPKTASYYGLLGDSYENINKNEDAIAAYRRGLLFENNGSLYYNIALVYETKLNDKKSAMANYNLYLKHFKDMSTNPKLASFIKNKIEELKR